MSAEGHAEESGIVFPDCVQVRVKMNGSGFRDVILNFAHLFDVVLPPELQQEATERPASGRTGVGCSPARRSCADRVRH